MEDLLRAALMNALTASALAVVVAGLSLILSRRPALVHCLWLIVLAKLAAPPLFEAPLGSLATGLETVWREAPAEFEPDLLVIQPEPIPPEPENAWTTPPPIASFSAITFEPETHDPTPIEWSFPWRALGLVWLAGAIAAGSVAVVRVIRFQRLLKDAEPAGDSVEAEIAGLAARMGLKRAPRAVLVEGRLAPLLWAVGRDPRLVLPRRLWKSLDARQRTLLLTHELAHWRRGDHRVRLFELAVTVAYWWLPVVWLVRWALRDAEEQCCDAWVVWMFPDDARTYAETLLDAVDFLNPVADPEPLLASGFGKATHLRRRLVMVMKGTTPRSLSWTGTLGALALAGILLPASPIWAQKDDVVEIKDGFKEGVVEFKAKPDEAVEVGLTDAPTETIRIAVKGLQQDREEAIQRAVEQLNAQIKALANKDHATDAEKLQERTLRKLVEQLAELEKSAITIKAKGPTANDDPFSAGPIIVEGKTLITPNREDEAALFRGKPTADPKEIEAAQMRVELLRREMDEQRNLLMEKQKEFGEAARELAQLKGQLATFTFKQVTPAVAPFANSLRSNRPDASPSPFQPREVHRLDQLENKLSKVLEELESLKKQKSEDGDQK